jgi:hypothetical protein
VDIDIYELGAYKYNLWAEDGSVIKEYPISFSTNDLFNATSGIGKKDGLSVYWIAGENRLRVNCNKGGSNPGAASAIFVPLVNMEYMKYVPPDPSIYPSRPNIRIQAKDFANLCKECGPLKCKRMDIIGQDRKIKIRLINNMGTEAKAYNSESKIDIPIDGERQEIDSDDEDEERNDMPSNSRLRIMTKTDLRTVSLPDETIKALSKIDNLSSNTALLRFYFAEGKPMKIETHIGTYGTYTICLRNSSQ